MHIDSPDSLDADTMLGFAFDYYFGSTPPTQGQYSAFGAGTILLHYSTKAFGPDPAPYLSKLLAQHGEKHVIDRCAELAKAAGKGQILSQEGFWYLFAHLLSIRPLHMRLFKESKIHVLAMTDFWNIPRSTPGDSNLSSGIAQKILFMIA